MPPVSVLESARAAYKAGLCVVPVREDGTKAPDLPSWTEFQKRRPTPEELKRWFNNGRERHGLFFILGKVSGNAECIEFDDADAIVAFKQVAQAAGLGSLVRRIELGYAEETPGGGVHWIYRVPEPRGNTKLASKPCDGCDKHQPGQAHVLIESRGEGGGIVAAPSSGTVHPTGRPYVLRAGGPDTIVELTLEERDELWQLARTMDEMPRAVPVQELIAATSAGDRPGDQYINEHTWQEVLEPAGWAFVFKRGEESYWRRPGKKEGVSATTNYKGSDLLYVFSSSVPQFVPEEGYNKFRAYALLHHGGDFQGAARAVGGYDPGPLKAQPNGATPTPPPPARPEPYRFQPVFPPGHFVADWIEHCSRRVDAAYEYHEAVALTMLSVATAGLKPALSVWPEGLKTNLYVLLVGHSSLSRKTTSIRFGRNLLSAARFDWKLPDGGSPEGLVEQIAHRSGKASLWAVSEFGQKLEDLERKASDAGLKKVLLEIYDGDDYEHRRVDKRARGQASSAPDVINVRDPYVSIIGGATEDVLQALSTRDIASGLLPRFAYVWPTSKPEYMDVGDVDDSWTPEFNGLALRLASINEWVTGGGTVTFSAEARAILNKENRALDEEAAELKITARLGAMCWKLAILATAGEFSTPPTQQLVVDVQQARWAVAIVRRWRAGALRFGGQVGGETVDDMRFNQRAERVIQWLREHGGATARRDVVRALNMTKRAADEVEQTLNDQGRMGYVDEQTAGRPTRRWVLQ